MTTGPFVTALLLTRSPRLAEQAVVRAIGRSGCNAESVLRNSIAESLKVRVDVSDWEIAVSSAILPGDLRWLLGGPLRRQRCIVLRLLVGMTREECAEALNIEPSLVDLEVVEGVMRLAAGRSQTKNGYMTGEQMSCTT